MQESPVPASVVEERMAALRALAEEKSAVHGRQFVGRELDAITLHTPRDAPGRGPDRCADRELSSAEIEVDRFCPPIELIRVDD